MTSQLTPHEWEALSAYLDDQLNPKERSRIEMRLKDESDYRQLYDELGVTRKILRSAPRLRAPRNFTLSPAMAGINKRVPTVPSFYSGLRLASLLATFFFVLITAGSLIARNSAPSQTVMLQSGSQNAAPVPFGKGGGGGGGGAEPPSAPVAPTVEASTLQMEETGLTPEALTIQVTPLADTGLAATEAPVQALAAPRASAVIDETPMQKEPQFSVPPPSETFVKEPSPWSFVVVIQIILALLAIITGSAAFIFHRRYH